MARTRPLASTFRYRHPIEIRYNDTDALGHVNNAVYFSYFEAARGGYYTEVVGHPFGTGPDAEKRTFVIAEGHIAYRAPAFYGEPLFVGVRVDWVSRSAFSLEYLVEVEASAIGTPASSPMAPPCRSSTTSRVGDRCARPPTSSPT